MWNKTKATEILKIKYPIIQGPFGGKYSSAKLASSVSNMGGMGSFGLNAYDPDEIRKINAKIRSLTERTYALNLWVPFKNKDETNFNSKDFEQIYQQLKPYFDELELAIPKPEELKKGPSFDEQLNAILESSPPVMSFIFGIPEKEVIQALKRRKIKTIGTATSVEEAALIEEAGFDLVVASGMEAGGHRASFLKSPEESLLPTRTLLKSALKEVRIPVIAAGGITTGKDIYTMLQNGASAAQLGTVFLATEESAATAQHREALLSENLIKTNLTKVHTGRLARAISNRISEDFDYSKNKKVAPYPIQSQLMSSLRKKALSTGKPDVVAFWAGQPTTIIKYKTVKSLFDALIVECLEDDQTVG